MKIFWKNYRKYKHLFWHFNHILFDSEFDLIYTMALDAVQNHKGDIKVLVKHSDGLTMKISKIF